MNIDTLIKRITPLYNEYKSKSTKIKGTEALKIMWEIGDILKEHLNHNNIAPHSLYRKIYGKSEGTDNITQKSYITREFLSRSYRIRNIFENKQEIEKVLPTLKKFITFREAMPFFDNMKYKLKGEDMRNLLSILNSSDSTKAMQKVKTLQKKHIGIKNPRNQKLEELSTDKEIFIRFYNHVYTLSNKPQNEKERILKEWNINKETVKALIQDTSALTEDGLLFSKQEYTDNILNDEWASYINFIQKIKSQNNPKITRRFRRLVAPMRMMTLAEMLNKLIV